MKARHPEIAQRVERVFEVEKNMLIVNILKLHAHKKKYYFYHKNWKIWHTLVVEA